MFCAVAMFLATYSASNAQFVIWPTADTNTINASQFKGGLAGWTTRGIYSDTIRKTDSAVWVWKANGAADRGAYSGGAAAPAIQSPSVANGAMVYDGDFYDTRGTAGAFGTGQAPSNTRGEMVSPIINAAGYTDIFLTFSSFYRPNGNSTSALFTTGRSPYIAWSTDGGVTWKDSIRVPFGVATNVRTAANDVQNIKLRNTTGTPNFRVKFVWDGSFYFWTVDDVRLIKVGVDMQPHKTFYAIPTNFITPGKQAEPIRFLADISNQGAARATGVKLKSIITDNATGNVVHTSTLSYPNPVNPGDTVQNVLSPNTFTPPTTSTPNGGTLLTGITTYSGAYAISSDSSEYFNKNDTLKYTFGISDSIFQKDRGVAGGTTIALGAYPAAAPLALRVGNGFYIKDGRNVAASAISFGMLHDTGAISITGKTIQAFLYKVAPTAITDSSGTVNFSGCTAVAGGEYIVQNARYGGRSYDTARIPIFDLNLTGNKPYVFLSNTQYLAVIEFQNTTRNYLYMAVDGSSYSAMTLATAYSQNPRIGPVWTTIGGNFDAQFFTLGTGYAPVVRLSVTNNYNISTKEVLSENNKFEVYPNPATESLTLDLDLVNTSAELVANVIDVTGRTMFSQTFQNVKKDQVKLDLSSLSNGTYMVKITTQDGTRTKKFVVAK
jgi:hypothetical protein